MQTSREELIQHFSGLSDTALLEVPREDLVQVAKHCLDEEISRRGLNDAPDTEDAVASGGAAGHLAPPMAVLGEYQNQAEAELACSLLRSAGIEAVVPDQLLANELNIPLATGAYHLLAPVESEQEALQILGSEISDEDLAAQAEAAGQHESEPEMDE